MYHAQILTKENLAFRWRESLFGLLIVFLGSAVGACDSIRLPTGINELPLLPGPAYQPLVNVSLLNGVLHPVEGEDTAIQFSTGEFFDRDLQFDFRAYKNDAANPFFSKSFSLSPSYKSATVMLPIDDDSNADSEQLTLEVVIDGAVVGDLVLSSRDRDLTVGIVLPATMIEGIDYQIPVTINGRPHSNLSADIVSLYADVLLSNSSLSITTENYSAMQNVTARVGRFVGPLDTTATIKSTIEGLGEFETTTNLRSVDCIDYATRMTQNSSITINCNLTYDGSEYTYSCDGNGKTQELVFGNASELIDQFDTVGLFTFSRNNTLYPNGDFAKTTIHKEDTTFPNRVTKETTEIKEVNVYVDSLGHFDLEARMIVTYAFASNEPAGRPTSANIEFTGFNVPGLAAAIGQPIPPNLRCTGITMAISYNDDAGTLRRLLDKSSMSSDVPGFEAVCQLAGVWVTPFQELEQILTFDEKLNVTREWSQGRNRDSSQNITAEGPITINDFEIAEGDTASICR